MPIPIMNDMNAADREAWIDRYLNGHMADDEREAFEIALLNDPDLLAQVRMMDAFKRGLQAEQRRLVGPDARDVVLPFLAWLRQPQSLAASVLVAVLGVLVAGDLVPTGPDMASSMPVGTVVLLQGERGDAGQVVTGPGPYLLQIDAGLRFDATRYGVTLREATGNRIIAEQQDLGVDGNGWVRMLVDEPLAGSYRVELTWRDAQGALQLREYSLSR